MNDKPPQMVPIQNPQPNPRLTFDQFFDKVAWACLTAIALYAATQIKSMGDSVQSLNTNVAVVVATMNSQSKTLDSHDERIRILESARVRR